MALPVALIVGAALAAAGGLAGGITKGRKAKKTAGELETLASTLAARAGGRARQGQIARGMGIDGRSQFATEAAAGSILESLGPQIAGLNATAANAFGDSMSSMLSGAGKTFQAGGMAKLTESDDEDDEADGGNLQQLIEFANIIKGGGKGNNQQATPQSSGQGQAAQPQNLGQIEQSLSNLSREEQMSLLRRLHALLSGGQ